MPTRLNLGSGPALAPGWLNADKQPYAGLDACGDLRAGLPLPAASIDAIVAMHVLQDLAWGELPGALAEIRRLMKPGGALRLGLPDLDRAMDAYRRGDGAYFFVPDSDARSLGAKLVTQIIWYGGSVRTPFTFDFAHELLLSGPVFAPSCAAVTTKAGMATPCWWSSTTASAKASSSRR